MNGVVASIASGLTGRPPEFNAEVSNSALRPLSSATVSARSGRQYHTAICALPPIDRGRSCHTAAGQARSDLWIPEYRAWTCSYPRAILIPVERIGVRFQLVRVTLVVA